MLTRLRKVDPVYTVLVPAFVVSVAVLALAIPALIVVENVHVIASYRSAVENPYREPTDSGRA